MGEVIAAGKLLENDWGVSYDIWNVTSYSELRKEAEEADRWNTLNPRKKQRTSHLTKAFSDHNIPTIATTDYIKMVSEQIGPYVTGPYYTLGTDGFGRSDTRENLRRFFEVDRHYIVLTAIRALTTDGKIEKDAILKAIKKYNINPDKPSPVKV